MFSKDRRIIIFIALLIYRIPLSHIIGDNGSGFLSGPFEVFWLLLMLFGSGLTSTLRGMMNDRFRREQYKNAYQIYVLARRYTIIVALLLSVINILAFDFISARILCDSGQRLAYLFVGPAVALGLLVDLNLGYLTGTENTAAAVLGEIVEAVSLGVTMILGGFLGQRYGANIAALLINPDVSAMYGAMGVMIGVCVGELIALITLSVMTIIYQRTLGHLMRSDINRKNEYVSDVTGRLIGGVLLDGALNMLFQLPIIIMLILFRKYGAENEIEDVGAMVGAYHSKYLSVVGILSAIAVWSVPSGLKGIQAAVGDGDYQTAGERISRIFGRVVYFSIPATVFATMLVETITSTLFVGRTTTINSVLTVGCSVILLYSLMYLFVAVLIKTGYLKEMLLITGVSVIITVIFGFIFIFKKGMAFKGITFILIIFYGIITIFSFLILYRNYKMRLRLLQQFLFPVVIAGIIGVIIKLMSGALLGVAGGTLTLIISLILGWLVYNLACMFLRVCSAGAMERKLFGRLLVRLGQNIGIY